VLERWAVRAGDESFRGSTTHGELRVLCGLDGHYEGIHSGMGSHCLPGQLRAQGFESIGYHGFQLTMFDRERWWPHVGLTPHIFDYQRVAAESKNCHNVFRGVCDVEALRLAVDHVQADRRLSYVLTLDTHLPLPTVAGTIPDEVRELCKREGMSVHACELVNQFGLMLRALASQLAAGSGTPYVAIVGDHAPPFLERKSQANFLPSKVAYILLEPKLK